MLRVAGLGGRPIGYYIFHRVNEIKHRFSRKARARRMQDFRRLMKIKGGERIIDLGGTPQFWEDIDTPLELTILRCLIPRFDGAICSLEWKEALWDKYVMAAPRPRTQSEQL